MRLTPKIASGLRFFCGRQGEKPCDFCSEMVASPLAATVVTAILRCDFCAAKVRTLPTPYSMKNVPNPTIVQNVCPDDCSSVGLPIRGSAAAKRGGFQTGGFLGRTPKGAYSTRGRSRHLLETPFSEPLLRTLLRALSYCKSHSRPPSQNPSENPSPELFPEPSQNPSWNAVLRYDPLGVHPSFPIWTYPSFFVLFGIFPFFLGFSRFARGWSGDFPDLLGDGPGIFPIRPFSLSRPIKSTYEEQSRKGLRHNLDLSRKKVGNPRDSEIAATKNSYEPGEELGELSVKTSGCFLIPRLCRADLG